MIIKEPKVELWLQDDPVIHVAKCARVCYGKKEGKSTDQQLYDSLLKSKHNSMFRHESVYAIVPLKEDKENNTSIVFDIAKFFKSCPYVNYTSDGNYCYIVTNQNFMIDYKYYPIAMLIKDYQVSPKEFENASELSWNMMRYTFHITTQISTSRELNRVSPNNIVERSTRFCVEDGVIVRPHWMSKKVADEWNEKQLIVNTDKCGEAVYCSHCNKAFEEYKWLVDSNFKRQDARGILPLDTATEVVYTYSLSEWRHIIELRSAKNAHPNCVIIANMIKKELEDLGYEF